MDVAEVLRLPQFKPWSVADVQRVVDTNDKQRFCLRPDPSRGHLQIRANQGHSLEVREKGKKAGEEEMWLLDVCVCERAGLVCMS